MSEFSSWDSRSGWFGLEIPPIRAKFGMHHCIYCGNVLALKKLRCEEKFYDIKEVYRFSCPKCKKLISPITQLSFEDHEKRWKKISNLLLKFVRPEQITKAWVDNNKKVLEVLDLEKSEKCLFLVKMTEKNFYISCSKTKRMKTYFEYPIKIIKDRDFKKTFAEMKNHLEKLKKG